MQEITPKQRQNLATLASYLEKLPADYEHFDMRTYARHLGECDAIEDPDALAVSDPEKFFENCGTVACALGHGPAAGIPFERHMLNVTEYEGARTVNVRWNVYSDEQFGLTRWSYPWMWCFGGTWVDVDNTVRGAAARLRYFLDSGVPDLFTYHENGSGEIARMVDSRSCYQPYLK
jgi:hypothetical protein